MLNAFGKMVRRIRLERGHLLKDMADILGVTSSFLSAVENGKKAVPETWVKIIVNRYNLDIPEAKALERAIEESKSSIKINLSGCGNYSRDVALSFAREFKQLGVEELEQINQILKGQK